MPAGTIALTNNSATVGGTGTAFTTELKAGDFIGVTVGGSPYTMIVASIASNTQLTIAQAYNGPTASGLAWYGVPATLKYAITQQVLNDMATNQRGMIAQLANWQKIYSDAASVTVERPDRSTFTGPSWGYIASQYAGKASLVDGAVPISQGGTGATTAETARNKLGLGSAATRELVADTIDTTPNRVVITGYFGVGSSGPSYSMNAAQMLDYVKTAGSGFFRNNTATTYNDSYAASVLARSADTWTLIGASYNGNGVRVAAGTQTTAAYVYDLWTSRNTTVDTNNFIKRASPIARLTNDISQMQPDFAVDNQHIIAGLVSVNAEAEGVAAERISTGVYQVKGAVGLAEEGWTLEVPQDINGNRLCFVKLETDKDGIITVSVFKRRFDVDTAMIVAGDPMDIPSGRWIDLRLEMPEDSVWKTRMREMEQATEVDEPTS